MKHQVNSAGALALIDRRTNQLIDSEPVSDSDNPYLLPSSDTFVWHYIKVEYFERILLDEQLRFGRLDKQSDTLDGTYSAENANEWTGPMAAMMKRMNIHGHPDWRGAQQYNESLRKRAFVHCWSMRKREEAWMWVTFLKQETRSVAIRTTLAALTQAIAGQSIQVVRTPYIPPGKPRLDFSYSAPFMSKASEYAREREIRLLAINEIGAPEEEFKLVPVRTRHLVRRVVVHPECPSGFRDEIRSLLARYRVPVHVACSRLRPSDLIAVRKAIALRQHK
jgi:hypothetical protein